MSLNDLSYEIRGAAYEVYNELGPGLLESVYSEAFALELDKRFLNFSKEETLPIFYKKERLMNNLRTDFIVESKIIVEFKSVQKLEKIHFKQLMTYLKVSNIKLGILINFNESDFSNGIKRLRNGY